MKSKTIYAFEIFRVAFHSALYDAYMACVKVYILSEIVIRGRPLEK